LPSLRRRRLAPVPCEDLAFALTIVFAMIYSISNEIAATSDLDLKTCVKHTH
jgi:hypothetical protein